MPIEERLENAKKEVERQIKMALLKKNMTQTDIANITGESRSEVSKAVKGNTNPHSTELRKKIYKILGME